MKNSVRTTVKATRSIAVVESKTWWTTEIRRQFVAQCDVRHFTSIARLLENDTPPNDLVIVVCSQHEQEMANLEQRQLRELFESYNTVLISESGELQCEWSLREIGCLDVVTPPITRQQLARYMNLYQSN